jgi:hypothetical protein
MRLSPRRRQALRKRNAIVAAAKGRACHADMRDELVTVSLVHIPIKAVGVSMPTGSPVMPQNKLHDGLELRRTHAANGGLSKDVVEVLTPADPTHNVVPQPIVKGDPSRLLRKRLDRKGEAALPYGARLMPGLTVTVERMLTEFKQQVAAARRRMGLPEE